MSAVLGYLPETGRWCASTTNRTAEQWIKEGKQAVKMTRLSCHRFRSNRVRLALSLLAAAWGICGGGWSRLIWTLAQQRRHQCQGRAVRSKSAGSTPFCQRPDPRQWPG